MKRILLVLVVAAFAVGCGGSDDSPACADAEVDCDGQCIDPTSSMDFCGAGDSCSAEPGVACDSGDACIAGVCERVCDAGQTVCDGACVDPEWDPAYCGAGDSCSSDPGEACDAQQLCIQGACVSSADSDGDGLSDVLETLTGTDPNDADSDDDGILDGDEDTNANGTVDAGELDPRDPDTDDDGLCDHNRIDNDGDGLAPTDACTDLVVFVDGDIELNGDGTRWDRAYGTIQQGIDAASAGQQVWVTAGQYQNVTGRGPLMDLKSDVGVYGGFLATETRLEQRPAPTATQSSLVGEAADGDPGDSGDNALHIIVASGVTGAVVDGFVVAGGFATDPEAGGGLFAEDSTLRVANSLFFGNESDTTGGAIAVDAGTLTVVDCAFGQNTAQNGGGAIVASSGATVSISGGGFGSNAGFAGGAVLVQGASVTVAGSFFVENDAFVGGALVTTDGSSSDISESWFVGNAALGGGAAYLDESTVAIADSVFFANMSQGPGTVLSITTTLDIANSVFAANTGDSVLHTEDDGATTIVNATFAANAGDVAVDDGVGDITSLTNIASWGNGGATLDTISGTIQNSCTEDDYTASGNVQLAADPFAYSASGMVFLDQAGGCVDIGDNAAATAAGIAWDTLTTDIDATLDTGTVDSGMHIDPNTAWVKTLEDSAGILSWTTHNVDSCMLNDGTTVTDVAADGQVTSMPDTTYNLQCTGPGGDINADITVPPV